MPRLTAALLAVSAATFLAAPFPSPALAAPPQPGQAAAAAPAHGSLNHALIAPDASWVFHLDLTALRASRLGEILTDSDWEHELSPSERNELRRIMPVVQKLSAITVYGWTRPDDAVLLLRATATPDEVLSALTSGRCGPGDPAPEEGAIEAGGYTLRTWTLDHETVFAYAHPGEGGDPGLIIASNTTDNLVAAIDISRGKRPSLVDEKGLLATAAQPRPGSTMLAVATGLERIAGKGRASVLLENARAVRVEMGEHRGQMFASVALTTDSSENARQVTDMARGLLAMGQMMVSSSHQHADLRTILQSLELTADGPTAKLTLSYDAQKAMDALHKARKADRPSRRGPKDSDAKNPDGKNKTPDAKEKEQPRR